MRGEVTDRESGKPIPGADVHVINNYRRRAVTDRDGRCVLGGIAPAFFGLVATAQGYGESCHFVQPLTSYKAIETRESRWPRRE